MDSVYKQDVNCVTGLSIIVVWRKPAALAASDRRGSLTGDALSPLYHSRTDGTGSAAALEIERR